MAARSQFLEHPGIQIASGRTLNTRSEHKFGAVPAMSQNQTGTIWDVNDTLYPWSTWDTPGVLTIPAVNAADNGFTVTVVGLDADYADQTEEFTVSSSGTTTGTKTFARVYRAFVTDSGASNTGNINIQRAGTTIARVTAGRAQTLMSVYTVPAGYTAYLLQGTATCQGSADASGFMYIRYFGQSTFRIGHSFEFSGAGGQYFYPFATPIRIPAKSDIDVRASVRSNNARLTASWDMILTKE